jgi:hypothetical protein
LLSLSLGYLLAYAFIALSRIAYPYELEWLEGGAVDHVGRILSGQKLYVSPSLDFIPYLYTPLYFYLSAAVAGLTGLGFWPLRLVSFLASVGVFFLVYAWVKRETGDRFWGLTATGFFAASFRASGSWFDLARVDSLFLFWLLLGMFVLRFGTSRRAVFWAAAIFTLSFLTKQLTLAIVIPSLLYIFLHRRAEFLSFILTLIAGIGLTTLVLNIWHQGWYVYYIFDLQARQPIVPSRFISFWIFDFMKPLGLAGLAALYYLFDRFKSAKGDFWFYFTMAVGFIGGVWYSRLHSGNFENVLMPMHALLAILLGLSLHRLLAQLKPSLGHKQALTYTFLALAAGQLILLGYNPFKRIPTAGDKLAGEQFIATMKELKGEVWVPYHAWLPTLAGKHSQAHLMSIQDVIRDKNDPVGIALTAQIEETLREGRYSAILLDDDPAASRHNRGADFLLAYLETYYERERPIFADEQYFWPVAGRYTRPQYVFFPKNSTLK